MRHALRRLGLEKRLICCDDGDTFIRDLLRASEVNQMPALCILDVKMPRRNGLETLAWVRAREEFQALPVVIMSASDMPTDITSAMALGANDYLVKPTTLLTLYAEVAQLAKRWNLT